MWHIKLVKGKSLANFKLNAIFSGEHALEEPCCYRNKSVSGRGLVWRDKRSIVCENNLCLDSGIFPDLIFSCLPLSYNKYCNEPRGKESGGWINRGLALSLVLRFHWPWFQVRERRPRLIKFDSRRAKGMCTQRQARKLPAGDLSAQRIVLAQVIPPIVIRKIQGHHSRGLPHPRSKGREVWILFHFNICMESEWLFSRSHFSVRDREFSSLMLSPNGDSNKLLLSLCAD